MVNGEGKANDPGCDVSVIDESLCAWWSQYSLARCKYQGVVNNSMLFRCLVFMGSILIACFGCNLPSTATENRDSEINNIGPLPESLPDSWEYRIGTNDLLKVSIFRVNELSSRKRVNSQGMITLPLIGQIRVGGLTVGEAQNLISERLKQGFLQEPQVNVYIEEQTSQRVTVSGAVTKPGVFPIAGAITLLQAIALAGGPTSLASTNEVIVLRTDTEGRDRIYIADFREIERGDRADPLLSRDDRIIVPESDSRIFIKGLTETLRGFVPSQSVR